MGEPIKCPHCTHPALYSAKYLTTNPQLICTNCRRTIMPSDKNDKFWLKVVKQAAETASSAASLCGWRGTSEERLPKGMITLCGCKSHILTVGDDKVVFYKDKWWKLKCLFVRVDRRMRKIIDKFEEMEKEISLHRKMKIKFSKMKNFIKKLDCSYCGSVVGNRFIQIGNGIYCGKCRHSQRETS
jgi:hypothetical protein